jgi:AhpD family alkylhydroperoxidase
MWCQPGSLDVESAVDSTGCEANLIEQRLVYYKASPDLIQALIAFDAVVSKRDLDASLSRLVKLRVSQVNGCVKCVEVYAADARRAGESERRLQMLSVWRQCPDFSVQERTALAWTESLTLVSQTHSPDVDYEAMQSHFSAAEIVNLTLVIGTINLWNRLDVGFRTLPAARESAVSSV